LSRSVASGGWDLWPRRRQKVHLRYGFAVIGYVVMPEHVHLLLSEPRLGTLAVGLQALKLSVANRSLRRPFWLRRYYDFNVRTEAKRIEKLQYIHWNPMKLGLVERPEDWQWSSCHFYQTGKSGRVTLIPPGESLDLR
jgi:putative transposase